MENIYNLHEFSPAAILAKIPIFSRQRCYGRWGILVVFIFSVLLGLNLKNLKEKIKSMKVNLALRFFLFLIVCVTSYDLLKFNSKHFKELFKIQIDLSPTKNQNNFPITISSFPNYGAVSSMYPAIISGYNSRDGYEMLFSPGKRKANGEKDYKGEFYLETGKSIQKIEWSPNKIHFIINSDIEEFLHVNMSYNEGWKVKNRIVSSDENGLVLVKVEKGLNEFSLFYNKAYYSIGLFAFAAAIFLIFVSKFEKSFKI